MLPCITPFLHSCLARSEATYARLWRALFGPINTHPSVMVSSSTHCVGTTLVGVIFLELPVNFRSVFDCHQRCLWSWFGRFFLFTIPTSTRLSAGVVATLLPLSRCWALYLSYFDCNICGLPFANPTSHIVDKRSVSRVVQFAFLRAGNRLFP